eukprot:14348378-Alexandrium_andersonii.AAC.1
MGRSTRKGMRSVALLLQSVLCCYAVSEGGRGSQCFPRGAPYPWTPREAPPARPPARLVGRFGICANNRLERPPQELRVSTVRSFPWAAQLKFRTHVASSQCSLIMGRNAHR